MAIKYNLDHTTKTSTPLPTSYGKTRDSEERKDNYQAYSRHIHEYQSKVGSIGHAAGFTRPDVAKSYSMLAEHLTNPTINDLLNANRCIQHLYSTRYLAILYHEKTGSVDVFDESSDAAFADDTITRRSSEAYLFRLFGGPIAWEAKKQPTVAKSTMEAELSALSRAGSHHKLWERFFRIGFGKKRINYG